MNTKLGKLLISGLRRRKSEIIRVCIATFLSVFFISGVLLFQENMYQWQMVENRQRFGDWFLIENFQQTKALENHPYLTKAFTAKSYAMMYDKNWSKTKINVGYMSKEFMEKGNIRIKEGRLPQSDNEIACDYNTLSKLGYAADLGQEIEFHYYNDDNSSSSDTPERTGTYILTGVLGNFTDSWSVMRYIPGALLTQEGCDKLSAKSNMVYMYGLKDRMRSSNYQPIYDELSKYNSKKVNFNKDVYDFKPWGPKLIYTYIYLLVMVIGVAALTYQIISYQHSRNDYYTKLYRLGCTKNTVYQSRTLENVLIMIPAGLIAIVAAVLTGRIVGLILEAKKGIAFFNVNIGTILKSLLALLVAFVVAELVNLVITYRSQTSFAGDESRTRKKINRTSNTKTESESITAKVRVEKPHHSKLKKNNVVWQMHIRLSQSNGIAMQLGARLFSLFITVVLIFCMFNIYTAFKKYGQISSKSDISGFQVQDGAVVNHLHFAYDTDQGNGLNYAPKTTEFYIANKRSMFTKEEYIAYQNELKRLKDAGESTQDYIERTGIAEISLGGSYCKLGNSTIIQGIDDNLKNKLETTNGIKDIYFSSYESSRDWDWDSREMSSRELTKLTSTSKKMEGYGDTYMYGTEYIDPTEALYQRLCKYIDPSNIDYESFKQGDQIVVFLQKNVNGGYDDSITPGTTINYQYYTLPVSVSLAGLNQSDNDDQESAEPLFPYWNLFTAQCVDKYYKVIKEGQRYNKYVRIYQNSDGTKTDEYYGLYHELMFQPCVSSKVVAVVQVTDDVKKDLSDILTEYGYYTAIASSELGKKAVQKQNTLMKDFLGDRYLDEMNCEYKYNQITATYDLSSSYSATDNILSSYFKANDVTYMSSANEKEKYRTNVLNALLQYGITMIATIVIDLLIYSILTRNRLELRRKRLELLSRLGAEKKRLRAICMIEVIRESLWCIFTAPLQILVQYIICKNTIKKY